MGVHFKKDLASDTDTTTSQDDPIMSHIIDRGDSGRSVHAIIMEARVNGTPVTAICGKTWVPDRDPQRYPLCSKCEEMVPILQGMYGV